MNACHHSCADNTLFKSEVRMAGVNTLILFPRPSYDLSSERARGEKKLSRKNVQYMEIVFWNGRRYMIDVLAASAVATLRERKKEGRKKRRKLSTPPRARGA
jgi:hypothetical protein